MDTNRKVFQEFAHFTEIKITKSREDRTPYAVTFVWHVVFLHEVMFSHDVPTRFMSAKSSHAISQDNEEQPTTMTKQGKTTGMGSRSLP